MPGDGLSNRGRTDTEQLANQKGLTMGITTRYGEFDSLESCERHIEDAAAVYWQDKADRRARQQDNDEVKVDRSPFCDAT